MERYIVKTNVEPVSVTWKQHILQLPPYTVEFTKRYMACMFLTELFWISINGVYMSLFNKKSRIYGTSDRSVYLSALLKLESAPENPLPHPLLRIRS